MKNTPPTLRARLFWLVLATIAFFAIGVVCCSVWHNHRVYAAQEKDAPHSASTDQSTSLNDQTDLAVTVYNSNIALVRDVRQLLLPSGAFRLKFMDIAATVNPATVHFRSLTEPDKLGV